MSDLAEFLLARVVELETWARESVQTFVDPAWMLAECEAKRRIVGLHRADPKPEYDNGHGTTHDEDGQFLGYRTDLCEEDGETVPCPTLRLLALAYADHPDYDESWRP